MMQTRPTNDEARLRPPARQTLAAEVAGQLERHILGTLQPGERLPPERELANHLEVSRLVIREALKLLAERGLVTARQGSGTYVQRVGSAVFEKPFRLYVAQHDVGVHDLFMVRIDLEGAIAQHAAKRATREDRIALKDNLEEMADVIVQLRRNPHDPARTDAFAWSDLAFHQRLAAATQNSLYETMLTPLVDTLLEVRRKGIRTSLDTADQALRDHEAILAAVVRRDAQQAHAAMRQHLERVLAWITPSQATGPGAQGPVDPTPPHPTTEES